MTTIATMREQALTDWQDRKNKAPGRVDNTKLPAGRPMVYYCHSCGWISDIKHEGWFLAQPRDECAAMQARGWLPS